MTFGVRSSLVALALLSTAGVALAAGEQGPGKPSTWSDPPPRNGESAKPAAPAPKVAMPAAASAAQQATRPHRKVASRPVRSAARHTQRRVARAAPARPASPGVVTRRPAPMIAMGPARPMGYGHPFGYGRPYPAYSAAAFPPDYEDERLDRLSTAVRSGYLVMRRSTVEYPDGRMIRVYRPIENGADD